MSLRLGFRGSREVRRVCFSFWRFGRGRLPAGGSFGWHSGEGVVELTGVDTGEGGMVAGRRDLSKK